MRAISGMFGSLIGSLIGLLLLFLGLAGLAGFLLADSAFLSAFWPAMLEIERLKSTQAAEAAHDRFWISICLLFVIPLWVVVAIYLWKNLETRRIEAETKRINAQTRHNLEQRHTLIVGQAIQAHSPQPAPSTRNGLPPAQPASPSQTAVRGSAALHGRNGKTP